MDIFFFFPSSLAVSLFSSDWLTIFTTFIKLDLVDHSYLFLYLDSSVSLIFSTIS